MISRKKTNQSIKLSSKVCLTCYSKSVRNRGEYIRKVNMVQILAYVFSLLYLDNECVSISISRSNRSNLWKHPDFYNQLNGFGPFHTLIHMWMPMNIVNDLLAQLFSLARETYGIATFTVLLRSKLVHSYM